MDIQSRVNSIINSESDSEVEVGSDEGGDDSEEDNSKEGGTGVSKGDYTWDDYVREYTPGKYRADDGSEDPPEYEDLAEKFRHDDLKPATVLGRLQKGDAICEGLQETVEKRTLNTTYEDEDEFFTTSTGEQTVVTRYDMEREVDFEKKEHYEEMDRYWVNKPYAFVILFRSTKENEIKYFAIEPHLNLEEERILRFLKNKLQDTIKFSDEATRGDRTNAERAAYMEEEAYKLLFRYDLIDSIPFETEGSDDSDDGSTTGTFKQKIGFGRSETQEDQDADVDDRSTFERFKGVFDRESNKSESLVDKLLVEEEQKQEKEESPDNVYTPPEAVPALEGREVRPQHAVINQGVSDLTDYQVMKFMYYLKRDSVSFGPIDPIKHDISIEDISCDGYNMRVWVYHGDYEQIISNIYHGEKELDDFVVNLAQRSGQGISKRQPQVDVTLPDGSRGQLTLGDEVSDHGTNYTIRQFNDVPFTPIDLINWKTFSPEQMAFLWLAIENHKSLIFAGGTASGKTTSLNAISLFIPSNTKVVSIEDTREVELPQRNWVASVTRPSFTEDGVGEVDEFALLEAALRQRPDYIVMGEIRGEEGRTLFQVMSTGHTTYTTFHADSVGEVIKRFTTDPINVSKTLFTALDIVSIQTATRVDGNKVRRNKVLTEINDYNSETDEINVNDVFRWIAEVDEFEQTENSEIMKTIMFDRGWDRKQLDKEIEKREIVIAYLIVERLNTYTQVAATVQAFINGPDIVLSLIANDMLEESLENLREMESVAIDIDPDKEEMVPRPEPPEEILNWAKGVLEEASEGILAGREGIESGGKLAALLDNATPTNAGQSNAEIDPQETETLIDQLDDGETKDEKPSSDSSESHAIPEGETQSEPKAIGAGDVTDEETGEEDEESEEGLEGFVSAGSSNSRQIGDGETEENDEVVQEKEEEDTTGEGVPDESLDGFLEGQGDWLEEVGENEDKEVTNSINSSAESDDNELPTGHDDEDGVSGDTTESIFGERGEENVFSEDHESTQGSLFDESDENPYGSEDTGDSQSPENDSDDQSADPEPEITIDVPDVDEIDTDEEESESSDDKDSNNGGTNDN